MLQLTRRTFLELGGAATAGALVARRAGAQLASYDDGNLDVPGGLSGPVERVVIVGAGISGLVVANALHAAGVPAVVVEGRSRIGGRMRTVSLGGVPVDLGAAWVHGPIGNPLSAWAAQNGIALLQADPTTGDISGYDPLIGSISSSEAAAAFAAAADFPPARFALRAALGPGATVAQGITEFLDQEGYSGDARRVIEFVVRTVFVELPYGGSADAMSLDWYYEDLAFAGLDHVPVGGYQGLIEAFDDNLDIRLGETVTNVAYGPGGVSVTTTSDVHTGSHALVTAPIGVLKAGALGFTPALPAAKTAAISRLDMGSYEKIYLQFSTPFWEGATPAREHTFYISDVAQGEYPVFIDWTPVASSVPTLSCGVAGSFAGTLPGTSEATITARVEAILAEIFPGVSPALRTPTAVAISDWGGDPFSQGAFPFLPVSASPLDMDELAAPVDGRLLFAGDATQSTYYGSGHGAMLSGIREAKRLLAQPSVQLPEPSRWLLQGVGVGALLLLARWRRRSAPREA